MQQQDEKRYKQQYNRQKASAKLRGIEWQFTFETWLAFWGEDIDKRGAGHDRLCMQRFADQGPYHPDNCKKDYAKENARTAGVLKRARNAAKGLDFTKRPDEDWDIVRKTFYPDQEGANASR